MHKLIRERIKDLKKTMALIKETDEDVKLTLKLFPEAHIWLDCDVNMDLAISNMKEVADVLKLFAKNGVHLARHIPDDVSPCWILQGKSKIHFTPVWSREEGAACRLVKIGEYTHTYPKYKLECKEE